MSSSWLGKFFLPFVFIAAMIFLLGPLPCLFWDVWRALRPWPIRWSIWKYVRPWRLRFNGIVRIFRPVWPGGLYGLGGWVWGLYGLEEFTVLVAWEGFVVLGMVGGLGGLGG